MSSTTEDGPCRRGARGTLLLLVVLILTFFRMNTVLAGPAPSVSSFEVLTVRSAQSGGNWERPYLSPSDITSKWDHGGAYIEVAVYQNGYSNSTRAVMNTYPMTLVYTEKVVNAQRVVTGFIYVYRIQRSMSAGTASFYCNSINGRTWSDSIRIR
ncbi:MAG: DUF4879 domain-containing protein [Planctomyces sp.]|jgi:hypothetical protein